MKAVVTMAEGYDNLVQHFRLGAPGYTGKLIVKAAVERGVRPILAGRDIEKVKAVAEPLRLIGRAFDLGAAATLDAALKDISV